MAAASPEFFKPSAFSPRFHHLLLLDSADAASTGAEDEEYHSCCRTPTDAGIAAHLGQPATCPPAPRKPRPHPDSACRKRLFDVDVISLRFDDLEAIFRPRPDAGNNNKHKQSRRHRRSQQGRASLN